MYLRNGYWTEVEPTDGKKSPNVAFVGVQKGAGGEVRVELDLTAVALTNGDIRVDGDAKLFEGTSESTNDLDGQRVFSTLVPKDRFTTRTVTVRNDDEGGDFATVSLSFSNRAV